MPLFSFFLAPARPMIASLSRLATAQRHRARFPPICPHGTRSSSSTRPRIITRDRWYPPRERERPPLPYKSGFSFSARRIKAPPPFLSVYRGVPTPAEREFIASTRFPDDLDEFLRNTTLVDYCASVAANPLPCTPLGEDAEFDVIGVLSRGHEFAPRSQLLVCKRRGYPTPLVAKVYDPLYYAFFDSDFPTMPDPVVPLAEHEFALEAAAYAQMDARLGGLVVPKFHGSWAFDVPLPARNLNRRVHLNLLEHVGGVPLSSLDPDNFTDEQGLRVIALAIEADMEIQFSGVQHYNIDPGNIIICSGGEDLGPDLRIRVVDFGAVRVLPLLGKPAPCQSERRPQSPAVLHNTCAPILMEDWKPDGWEDGDLEPWERWAREMWAGSYRYMPVDAATT